LPLLKHFKPEATPMKVFLSSTAQDLKAYRQVADDTILRLFQQAVVMERFGPLPGDPVSECERKARECDVLVCVVAHRYGFVPDKGKGSITQREVEAAYEAGRTVLAWIVAVDYPWPERKEQDLLTDPAILADQTRISEVTENIQSLLGFKAWLRKKFVSEEFTTPEDLGRKIAIALSSHCRDEAQYTSLPVNPARGEIRIVHALQPAPHFLGRDLLVAQLKTWISDPASPDRVWALVAAGGTGKTAVVEQVIYSMNPNEANLLVWSFYEKPDADAFLRECNHLFLGSEGPALDRLERLQRGLRDGRPHLIVLDGLELMQEDSEGGHLRGELSDHSLKLLLRSLAAGLGKARALLTSRFPLVDLGDWNQRGYRNTLLEDLSPESAVSVLRGWGAVGDDKELFSVAGTVGYHALSVAVIGSYVSFFADGNIGAVDEFELDSVTGDDPRAAKLARILAFYAQRLPVEERELLARLSVFPRGVSLDVLRSLVDAGGDVAGLLSAAKYKLLALLGRLRQRGLVFRYRSEGLLGDKITWSAHPFLRDRFRELLGCPSESVFAVVADSLRANLERKPVGKLSDSTELYRIEQYIEAERLAGRPSNGFLWYWNVLGNYQYLGISLGEFERGYRILSAFMPSSQSAHSTHDLSLHRRLLIANDLGLYALRLGKLAEAESMRRFVEESSIGHGLLREKETSVSLQNSSEVAFAKGYLSEAYSYADKAFKQAVMINDYFEMRDSLCFRALAAHAQGNISGAKKDFRAAAKYHRRISSTTPLSSLRGAQKARHLLDNGYIESARMLSSQGLEMVIEDRGERTIETSMTRYELPLFHSILARLALAENSDPIFHIKEIRRWSARTGDQEFTIISCLLMSRHLLASGDYKAALADAREGLFQAERCGFGLLRIELLVTLSCIYLATSDPPSAIQAASRATDLASSSDCGYVWGEAEAAQALGYAYYANDEQEQSQYAFKRKDALLRCIRSPSMSRLEGWFAHFYRFLFR